MHKEDIPMEVVSVILKIALLIASIGMIVVVLMQPSEDEGLSSAITGINPQSYLAGKQEMGKIALCARLTKILAVVMLVLTIALLVIDKFFG